MSLSEHRPAEDSRGPALMDASCINLPGILENISRFLPPNEITCTIRLVNKALLAAFHSHTIVRLSQLVPVHAFLWRWGCANCFIPISLQQRRDLLFLTAASGCLSNLEVAAASAGFVLQATPRQTKGSRSVSATALEAAAAAGHLVICKWLRGSWAGALAAAAGAGQLASGCPWDRTAVYAAARGGHVDLMEFLLQGGNGSSSSSPQPAAVRASGLLAAAAEGCDLATLQRLHGELVLGPSPATSQAHGDAAAPQHAPSLQQLLAVDKAAILLAAASSPTVDWREKVEWLEAALGCGPGGAATGGAGRPRAGCGGASGAAAACAKAAARPDGLERVAWLRARGYPLSDITVNAAAAAGNLPLLEYLLERCQRPSYGAFEAAAAAGQRAILEALHARRLSTPWSVVQAAAEGGHLEVVVWVLCNDDYRFRFCLPARLILGAARSGSAALMRWLLEHRDRWASECDKEPVFRHAAEGGCEEMLRLLAGSGRGMEGNGDPYYVAAVNGDLATLRCLRDLNCPWGAPGELFGVCVADGDCPTPVLRWLLEVGCPVGDWEAALEAAGRRTGPDREEVREWLQAEEAKGALAELVVDPPQA